MSKRVDIAKHMAESSSGKGISQKTWLNIIYALEKEGFQVVRTSETAEYRGLRNAGGQ